MPASEAAAEVEVARTHDTKVEVEVEVETNLRISRVVPTEQYFSGRRKISQERCRAGSYRAVLPGRPRLPQVDFHLYLYLYLYLFASSRSPLAYLHLCFRLYLRPSLALTA